MADADRMANADRLDSERILLVLRVARDGAVIGSWGEIAPRWRELARTVSPVSPSLVTDQGAAGTPAPAPSLNATLATLLRRPPVSLVGPPPRRLLTYPTAHDLDWEETHASADGTELVITSHCLADGDGLLTITERGPPENLDSATIRAILDLLPATVSIKNSQRRYLFVNRAWENYANVSRDTVLLKTHEAVAAPNLDPDARENHSRDVADRDGHVLATGQPLLAQEERYTLTNGIERTLLSNKLPLFDQKGAVTGVLSITMDVSDMVEAQALLEQARRSAEAANRSKANFLATISHELRTPLNGIVGLLSLLSLTNPNENQRALLARLTGSADELSKIIEGILAFSQSDDANPAPSVEAVAVDVLVEDAVAPMKAHAHAKGLSLQVDIPADARVRVEVDRPGIVRVLTELIGNAITFTEKGSITVQVTFDHRNSDDSMLQIDVIDTGIGIHGNHVSQLFMPFFQANQSSTRRHGGIGMGLAVCRRAVEAMGGSLAMIAPNQDGSVFRISLKVRLVDDGEHREARRDMGFTIISGRNDHAVAALRDQLSAILTSPPQLGGDPAGTLAMVARYAAAGQPTKLLIIHGTGMIGGDGPIYDRIGALFGTPRIPVIMIGGDPDCLPNATHLPDGATIDLLCSAMDGVESQTDASTTAPSIGKGTPVTTPVVSPPPDQSTPNNQNDQKAADVTRILLAEDNEVNQLVAVGMLNSLGYKADVVANGAEAVAALGRGKYAAILMDVRMPVMDGLEAARHIRALGGEMEAIPIIAVTANAMRGDQESCLAAGMNDYLAKPIRLATLDATLRRWVPVID